MQPPRLKSAEQEPRSTTERRTPIQPYSGGNPPVGNIASVRTGANASAHEIGDAEQASVATRQQPATEVAISTFHVYRFYAEDGQLLYVGQSSRLPQRLSQHRREKDWWAEVGRIELERFDSRAAALSRERELIRESCPPYNVMLNPAPSSRATEPDVADVRCCPSCGAPELELFYRLPATLCWAFIEGPPDAKELAAPLPDWFHLDDSELGVECQFCGDNWPADYGPDLCTDAEAEEWYARHPERRCG